MELVERMGGLGRIRVRASEEAKLKQLFDLIPPMRQRFNHLVTDPQEKILFEKIMGKLFPPFYLSEKKSKDREPDYYVARQTKASAIDVKGKSGFPAITLDNNRYSTPDINLQIIRPDNLQGDWAMSAMLSVYQDQYRLGVIDDLVNVMGSRLNPKVEAVKEIAIDWECRPEASRYLHRCGFQITQFGIADVLRIEQISDLYTNADRVLKETGMKYDLKVLREEMESHKNLYIRRGSAELYQQELENLASL